MVFDFNYTAGLMDELSKREAAPVAFASSDVRAATTHTRIFTPEEIDALRADVARLPEAVQTQLLHSVKEQGISDPQQIAGLIHEALQQRSDLSTAQKIAFSGELRAIETSNQPVSDQQVANAAPAIREEVKQIKDDKEKNAVAETQMAQGLLGLSLAKDQLDEAWRRRQNQSVAGGTYNEAPLPHVAPALPQPAMSPMATLTQELGMGMRLPVMDMGATTAALAANEFRPLDTPNLAQARGRDTGMNLA